MSTRPVDATADLNDRLARVLGARIEGLRRLTGGASRETWSFDSVDPRTEVRRELILRRDPPGAPRDGMELEARLLVAAARAGVPVPAVRAAGPAEPHRLETSYLVMDRVAGETIARKILRDPEYATARQELAAQCGAALAKLHAVDPDSITDLLDVDPIAKYRELLDEMAQPVPVFEWAFRWLQANRPSSTRRTLVHGDFRLGNLIIDQDGLRAVLDWELAHAGDPMEDLGWLCVRAWRFGGANPVAGVGTYADLLRAYEEGSGVAPDPAAVQYWVVAGTLMWGVICIMQASAHLSGMVRSVELAAIGRRVAEQEHDLLQLLAPEVLAEALAKPDIVSEPTTTSYGRPTAAELVAAVREYLEADVMTTAQGRVQFHARVAGNVLAIVERELARPRTFDTFGYPDEAALAAAIRSGELDDRSAELLPALADGVVARIRVANPKYVG